MELPQNNLYNLFAFFSDSASQKSVAYPAMPLTFDWQSHKGCSDQNVKIFSEICNILRKIFIDNTVRFVYNLRGIAGQRVSAKRLF